MTTVSMRTKYAQVFSQNRPEIITSFDNPEFKIPYVDREIVPGSWLLAAEKVEELKANGDAFDADDEIYRDPYAGDHVFFKGIATDCVNHGNIENINDYNRLVAMKNETTHLLQNLGAVTNKSVELVTGDKDQTRAYINGNDDGNGERLSFCIRPDFILNKSDVPLNHDRFGDFTVKLDMMPNEGTYYGAGSPAAAPFYRFTNLRLLYRYYVKGDPRTVGPDRKVFFERYHASQDRIESNDATISTNVPGLTSAVHITFNSINNITDRSKNTLERQTLPGKATLQGNYNNLLNTYGVEQVRFAVNEANNSLYGFTLRYREEQLWNYLRSYNNSPKDYALSVGRLSNGEGYGLGTPFGSLMDFRDKRFSCSIQSEASLANDNTKFSAYMYFPIVVQY